MKTIIIEDKTKLFRKKSDGWGLGATLGLLRFRGVLGPNSIEWAGRHNDTKTLPHHNLVKEALFSDKCLNNTPEDQQVLRLETALRRTDEYGRVLTAKQAFRKLCYDFHGKGPSKIREQKRAKKQINAI